jgi:hypothetical protein
MCSPATVNARQTPKLARPSANIAGSQTNRFITASCVPLGRLRPGKWLLRKMEDRHRGASISFRIPAGRHWLATAAAVNGSVSFPLCFDEAS